ncbi:hypothetical protein C8Q75DRAFT_718548 [Abortiporus biennis]|nr:hypothetical protein C8Q75DRAFT_718548 [Abortiporus biennis]
MFWSLPALEAALVNITIDDSGTDPITGTSIVYSPPDSWSPGQTCTDCQAHPDPSLALDHTWHDVLYIPANNVNLTASLQFEGSAIYVFCILAHTSSPLDGNSDMSFSIDGQVVGNFIQPPNGDPNFSYNSPVYVNTSIPAGAHTFMLQNGRQGGQTALALLDYIIYS